MSDRDPKKIKDIFNKISYKYDLLNNLLSFGYHNFWKKKLISLLNPKKGEIWADLCCGTGDLTLLISKKIYPDGSVTGIDNANQILEIAKSKSQRINQNKIKWLKSDVLKIDETYKYDGVCMSYGLRNLESVEQGLRKVFFLLNDKGRAGFLDFNHSKEKSFAAIFQKLYLRLAVVPISSLFNLKEEYAYIEKSINDFPNGNKLILISKEIGFKKANYQTFFGGQMGILMLEK